MVIKFLNVEEVKWNEIHKCLCLVYGGDALNRVDVYKWTQFFNSGSMEIHGKEQSG